MFLYDLDFPGNFSLLSAILCMWFGLVSFSPSRNKYILSWNSLVDAVTAIDIDIDIGIGVAG